MGVGSQARFFQTKRETKNVLPPSDRKLECFQFARTEEFRPITPPEIPAWPCPRRCHRSAPSPTLRQTSSSPSLTRPRASPFSSAPMLPLPLRSSEPCARYVALHCHPTALHQNRACGRTDHTPCFSRVPPRAASQPHPARVRPASRSAGRLSNLAFRDLPARVGTADGAAAARVARGGGNKRGTETRRVLCRTRWRLRIRRCVSSQGAWTWVHRRAPPVP